MKNYNLKMNLQLFADPSASLQNTTGTMTNEMKTFYEKRLIDQAEPRLVHDQFADYYPVPQNGGKTIEFRKYDSLPKADTPLTEGVTPNGQTLNVTTITSDLHQYGGWTPLTDVLQMTAIDNNVVQATRVLASQAGRTMDSITRDVLAGGTNVIYAPKLAADGTETAVASRIALATRQAWLKEADAMLRERFFKNSITDAYDDVGADLAWDDSLQDDDVLLAPAPFDALYPHYLCAMTDAALGETDRYVGEQAQYNSLLADLAAWLRRSYPTLTGAQWRW